MRFERLFLERYGAFTDRVLELRTDAQLHVVLGANEAGKTSALNAIGDLLFGFGHVTNYDFLHDKTTLRIGAQLRLADGSLISLRRRKGAKNTLLDANDQPLAQDPLAPLLGSVTRDVFFNEFGLTAAALREGGRELLRAGGRLAETLASTSAQLSALMRVRDTLTTQADLLFSPKAKTKPEFNVIHGQYKDVESRLREAIVTADALAAADRAVKEAQEQRVALNGEHDRIGRELARCERSQRTRPKLLRIDSLREELASLVDLPMVEAERLAVWRDAQDEMTRIEADLAQMGQEEAEAAAEISELSVNEPLLEVGDRIANLRETLGAVREAERDLPKRRGELFAAQDNLTKLARQLGVDTHEALLARQPSEPALALVREIIEKRRTTEDRLALARAAIEDTGEKLRGLEQDVVDSGGVGDSAPYAERLEALSDIPADADRLRRALSDHEAALQRLAEQLGRLDPPPGSLDGLARMVLPTSREIDVAKRTFELLDEEEKGAAAELRTLNAEIARLEEDIAELARSGAFATRERLLEARDQRERIYLGLGAALDADSTQRRTIFDALSVANRDVDNTTDLLLSGAERAARFEDASGRLAKEKRRYEIFVAARSEYVLRRKAAEQRWEALWSHSGVSPKTPAVMADWLVRVHEILAKKEEIAKTAAAADALSRKLGELRADLLRLCADIGTDAADSSPADVLFKRARAAIAQIQERAAKASAGIALRDEARRELARLEANVGKIEVELLRTLESWPHAMRPIGLTADAGLAQAKAALDIWQAAPLQRSNFEREKDRIEKMEANISAFESAVGTLIETVDPDLHRKARREALDILSERLSDSRRADEQRKTLSAAAQKRAAKREALATRLAGVQNILAQARAALGVGSTAPLAPTFDRLQLRQEIFETLIQAQRDLTESADGFDEEALRSEQAGLDHDALPGDIERLRIDVKRVLADIEIAATRRHEAAKARDALAAGHDAAGAAHDKAEAGAQLVGVASRWLARVAAARLATYAIERHRAAVQDPLLTRASALFAIATNGAFERLSADYDESDAPMLVGQRGNGSRVPVAGMSEGARDQLFLALRLALLELRSGEPLPFIGDDLLASFDDARTARALGLLAEFGHTRQAILFTHHRHVAEIARNLPGANVDLIEL